MQKTYAPFIQRRTKLYESLKKKDARKPLLFLFAGFESERTAFRQDSSFYYLTGLEEPATVLLMNEAGTTLLFLSMALHVQNGPLPLLRRMRPALLSVE